MLELVVCNEMNAEEPVKATRTTIPINLWEEAAAVDQPVHDHGHAGMCSILLSSPFLNKGARNCDLKLVLTARCRTYQFLTNNEA